VIRRLDSHDRGQHGCRSLKKGKDPNFSSESAGCLLLRELLKRPPISIDAAIELRIGDILIYSLLCGEVDGNSKLLTFIRSEKFVYRLRFTMGLKIVHPAAGEASGEFRAE
jgi:hypothetical protein